MADINKSFTIINGISLDETGVGIFTSTDDPRVLGEAAPVGSLLVRSTGELYVKTSAADNGWVFVLRSGDIAYDNLSPATTKGDLVAMASSGNIRLAVGADGYVLTADSTQPSGLKWAPASGGGGGGLPLTGGTLQRADYTTEYGTLGVTNYVSNAGPNPATSTDWVLGAGWSYDATNKCFILDPTVGTGDLAALLTAPLAANSDVQLYSSMKFDDVTSVGLVLLAGSSTVTLTSDNNSACSPSYGETGMYIAFAKNVSPITSQNTVQIDRIIFRPIVNGSATGKAYVRSASVRLLTRSQPTLTVASGISGSRPAAVAEWRIHPAGNTGASSGLGLGYESTLFMGAPSSAVGLTAIGYWAARNYAGTVASVATTALGDEALRSLPGSFKNNTAVGTRSLSLLLKGSNNVALGTDSASAIVNASDVVSIGYSSASSAKSSFGSVFVGASAGSFNGQVYGSMDLSVMIGRMAGQVSSGSIPSYIGNTIGNVFLGHTSGFGQAADSTPLYGSYNVAIGYSATITKIGDGQLNIQNFIYGFGNTSSDSKTPSTGRLVIGSNVDDGVNKLQVAGDVSITGNFKVNNQQLSTQNLSDVMIADRFTRQGMEWRPASQKWIAAPNTRRLTFGGTGTPAVGQDITPRLPVGSSDGSWYWKLRRLIITAKTAPMAAPFEIELDFMGQGSQILEQLCYQTFTLPVGQNYVSIPSSAVMFNAVKGEGVVSVGVVGHGGAKDWTVTVEYDVTD